MRICPRLTRSLMLAVLVPAATGAAAELQVAPRSPPASVSQTVGITTITVDYNSPAVGGRPIWTTVVPVGIVWRPGDGAVPKISFSRDVVFAGRAVAAGTYALLMIPGANDWSVILSRDTRPTGPASYRPDLDVARGTARVEPSPHRERLTFLFPDFSDDQALLALEWDDRRVCIPIAVHTQEQIQTAIRALDDGWRWYADAAVYMLEKKRNYDAGLRYIDQSLVLEQNWRNVWIKASLLAARGEYRKARAEADRAYELGRTLGEAFTIEPAIRRARAAWGRSADAERPASVADAERPASVAKEDTDPPRAAPAEITHATIEPARTSGAIVAERSARGHGSGRSAGSLKPPAATEIGPRIRKGRPEIQSCYQRALRQDPTLTRARLTVSIDIGVSGLVKRVALDPPHPSGALESCIKGAISRWVFPTSPVEYATEFPVVLRGAE